MPYGADSLIERIIRPVLHELAWYSPRMAGRDAELMLAGTAAAESDMGRHRRQMEGGPARGIYQCEPATARDILGRYLGGRPALREVVARVVPSCRVEYPDGSWHSVILIDQAVAALEHDDATATAVARLKYWADPAPLPPASEPLAAAELWKRVFNTPAGGGTVEHFLAAHRRHVRPYALACGLDLRADAA
jgi:hypothetical protein